MNIAPTIVINDNLTLRQPKKEDIAVRFALGRSIEFRKMVGGSVKDIPAYTIKNAEALYDREMKNKYSWFIVLNGKMIGVCRIRIKSSDLARYSIGIYDDNLFSKGIGTTVTKTVIDFAFSTLKIKTLELMVLEYNERAIACYKKCGFTQSDLLKNNIEIDGRMYNDIIMTLENI